MSANSSRSAVVIAPPSETSDEHTYSQILKSSALVGGAQVLNIVIGIARTKIMAVLLGPAGFGLAGLFNSIVDLTQNIAGLGVNSSGVRQIAEAANSEDSGRIPMTIAVLRRTSLVLGALGALALILFCRQISQLTFGTDKYSAAVAALSIAAFFKLISGGQAALIQGMQRIAHLAKMNVFGALFGAIIGVALIYIFRENGILFYVIGVAALSALMSWWYSRKVQISKVVVSGADMQREVRSLLKLGIAFMVSSMMTLGVAYAIRVMVTHKVGMEGTGLYQSAWTLGGMYVSFILQAMGADFYPRLTRNIANHEVCNRLVNEQARVGLLLAGPGVIATLTFAPLVISLLYSSKFGASVPILRWMSLGAGLQVITWPMGFIIVAKARQNIFIFCEVAWAVVSVALAWACINLLGLRGAGVAFFLSYIFHGFLVYPIVRRLTGFAWSRENTITGSLFLTVTIFVFVEFELFPHVPALILGIVATIATTVYSVHILMKVMPLEELPRPIRRLFFKMTNHKPQITLGII